MTIILSSNMKMTALQSKSNKIIYTFNFFGQLHSGAANPVLNSQCADWTNMN